MRRNRLNLALAVGLITFLSFSCTVMGASYQEAPQLAKLVAEGKLPPVEERLPDEPVVVEVRERIGQYGGTWRKGLVGGHGLGPLQRTAAYENLVRWDHEWSKASPNIAESWEANPEATEYVFQLRKGIKWSDGVPFTADDIMFWWEDVACNKELSPGGPPGFMKIGGESGSVEKIDDYTIACRFPEPNGLFLFDLCDPGADIITAFPRHHFEKYHVKYNKDIDQLIKEHGVSDWVSLFFKLMGGSNFSHERFRAANRPGLYPWVVTNSSTERIMAERNPYYWKVDPEGNQLPYIDRIVYDIYGDRQVLLLRAV